MTGCHRRPRLRGGPGGGPRPPLARPDGDAAGPHGHREGPGPRPPSALVGRADAIEEVLRRLDRWPVVTVAGPGGAGKTRLARAVAATLGRSGRPVAFVDLSVVSDAVAARWTVASATGGLGPAPGAGPHPGDRGAVVVLDSCEHLRPACALLAPELVAAGASRVLLTSRQPVGAPGEVVWPIPPLSVPPQAPAASHAVLAFEAVQLFCQVGAADHGFRPGPDDLDVVAAICRRLEGNPLALELAAARLGELTPAGIAARLDRPLALLEAAGGPTVPPRHRSLRASLDWSLALLSPAEAAGLRRLSVFPADFGAAAAEEVCGAGEGVLDRLSEVSLLSRLPAPVGRFRLPELVRHHAAEGLARSGEAGLAARRHARWCAAAVEAALGGGPGGPAPGPLEPGGHDLAAALAWAVEGRRTALAVVLARGLAHVWPPVAPPTGPSPPPVATR